MAPKMAAAVLILYKTFTLVAVRLHVMNEQPRSVPLWLRAPYHKRQWTSTEYHACPNSHLYPTMQYCHTGHHCQTPEHHPHHDIKDTLITLKTHLNVAWCTVFPNSHLHPTVLVSELLFIRYYVVPKCAQRISKMSVHNVMLSLYS